MITGKVTYTSNAFAQDGEQAINKDIVLALLELITNADDAYASADGPIRITVSQQDSITGKINLSVSDKAKGLSPEMLVEKFTVLGGTNEQFQSGENSRGLLGRGAKDVASLGSVTFKTIKDGTFSTLTLSNKGTFEAQTDILATSEHQKDLMLNKDENGLTATIHIDSKNLNIKVPSLNELSSKLATHAQLRDLIVRREVTIVDNRSASPNVRVEGGDLESETILDETFSIPGYPGDVRLVLNRLKIRQTGKPNSYSAHGILVKSGITIYENSSFGQEAHPSIGFISGSVTASDVNSLIRKYDMQEDVAGSRLIRRDRDGLVKDHPYTVALTVAIQAHLIKVLDNIQQEFAKHQGQGENLTRALKDAARALRSEVNEIMKELEQANAGSGGGLEPDVVVIPPQLKIKPNSTATLTVRVSGVSETEIFDRTELSSHINLISVEIPKPLEWRPHERLDVAVSSLQVHAGEILGNGLIKLSIGGHDVGVPVTIAEPTVGSSEPVTKLHFVTPNARIAPTKTRRLEIRAAISESDNQVDIFVSGVEINSSPKNVILRASSSGLWSSAFIEVQAGQKVGALEIETSTLSGERAKAVLLVQEGGPTGGLDLDFDLVSGQDSNSRVVLWPDHGVIRMYVHTDHKAFNNVFGKFDEVQKKYLDEDSPEARQVLVEVLARALGEHFTVEQSVRNPTDFSDGNHYFARCHELNNRFLKVFNAALKVR